MHLPPTTGCSIEHSTDLTMCITWCMWWTGNITNWTVLRWSGICAYMSCVVCVLDASLENCLAILTGLHTRIMLHLSLHALCMWQLAVLVKLCIAECVLNQTRSALSTSNAEYTFSITCDQQHLAYCKSLLNANSVCWKVNSDQAGVTLLQSCGRGWSIVFCSRGNQST